MLLLIVGKRWSQVYFGEVNAILIKLRSFKIHPNFRMRNVFLYSSSYRQITDFIPNTLNTTSFLSRTHTVIVFPFMQSFSGQTRRAFVFYDVLWPNSRKSVPFCVACKNPLGAALSTRMPRSRPPRNVCIEQCNHHFLLCSLSLPQATCCPNSKIIQSAETWRAPVRSLIFSSQSLQTLLSVFCFYISFPPPPHPSISPFLPMF